MGFYALKIYWRFLINRRPAGWGSFLEDLLESSKGLLSIEGMLDWALSWKDGCKKIFKNFLSIEPLLAVFYSEKN